MVSFQIPSLQAIRFLFVLTVIQFWWIAVWGLAYIAIQYLSKNSRTIESMIYIIMLLVTILLVHTNPSMLEKL
jgi:hypothetical protein